VNRNKALSLLGLSEGCSSFDVELSLLDRLSENKLRASAAPTEILRNKYSLMEHQLEEAGRLLQAELTKSSNCQLSESEVADLPSQSIDLEENEGELQKIDSPIKLVKIARKQSSPVKKKSGLTFADDRWPHKLVMNHLTFAIGCLFTFILSISSLFGYRFGIEDVTWVQAIVLISPILILINIRRFQHAKNGVFVVLAMACILLPPLAMPGGPWASWLQVIIFIPSILLLINIRNFQYTKTAAIFYRIAIWSIFLWGVFILIFRVSLWFSIDIYALLTPAELFPMTDYFFGSVQLLMCMIFILYISLEALKVELKSKSGKVLIALIVLLVPILNLYLSGVADVLFGFTTVSEYNNQS